MSNVWTEPLSVNQFKAWSRCRKKYYYDYVQKLRWPKPTAHFNLGRSVHKLLEFQAQGIDSTVLIPGLTPAIRSSWELLMAHPLTQLPVVANEWGFQVPVHSRWLIGWIDRIAQEGEQLLVIDWKTGTGIPKDPVNDWQTRVYLYAVLEACESLGFPNLPPHQVAFVYAEVRQQVREVRIPYDAQRHEETRRQLQQTVEEIAQETTYPLPETCPDRYCPYGAICGINETPPSSPLTEKTLDTNLVSLLSTDTVAERPVLPESKP